jgi:geranylgeranyl pyrophosphate synthase
MTREPSREEFIARLQEWRELVDATLVRHLPPADTPPAVIHEAMRYAVLGGGKRVRPIMALAAALACGAEAEPILQQICALELIHTYSLVHDDLRRGRKTTHIVFGEAMAILTGDALLTEAFSWLARPVPGLDPARQLRAVAAVATAVDSKGMIGGQVADIEAERWHERPHDPAERMSHLEFIHANKTGKLLTASAVLGGLLAGGSDAQIAALGRYGDAVGLAFQIVDDLLDLEETAATLGKTAGKDLAQGKLTYPALVGNEAARAEAARLVQVASENAAMIGSPVNYLAAMARYIGERRS